jgi:hypothetical protein
MGKADGVRIQEFAARYDGTAVAERHWSIID